MIGQKCPFIPNGHEPLYVSDFCLFNIVQYLIPFSLFYILFVLFVIFGLHISLLPPYGSDPGPHSRRFSPLTPTTVRTCIALLSLDGSTAVSSLVHSRQTLHTPTLEGALSSFCFVFMRTSLEIHQGVMRTLGSTQLIAAFEVNHYDYQLPRWSSGHP